MNNHTILFRNGEHITFSSEFGFLSQLHSLKQLGASVVYWNGNVSTFEFYLIYHLKLGTGKYSSIDKRLMPYIRKLYKFDNAKAFEKRFGFTL